MTGSQLMQQNPQIAQAMQFHQQMQGGGQPGQPPQAPPQPPQPQGQPGMDGKIPTPPDIAEREIILKAMAGHLQTLDSVIKESVKPQQGGQHA